MYKLIQIFIAIIPFVFSLSTSDPTLAIRFLVLSIFLSGVLAYYIFTKRAVYKEIIIHPVMIFFGVMLIMYFLSMFFNGFGSESIYIILKLFLLYVFALILIQFMLDEGSKSLLNSFLYFSLFLSAIYFFQIITNYYDIMSIAPGAKRNSEFDSIAATMGHKNLLASIQFLMLPILIHIMKIGNRVLRILSGVAILLVLLTILQTQSRAAFFALGIFTISVFILNITNLQKKHLFAILLGGVLLFCSGYFIINYTERYEPLMYEINKTLDFTDFTSSSRYKLYSSSFQLIADNLIFGVGPGNWKVEVWNYGLYFENLGRSFAQRPHNDFLWVFSEAGFVAGISYILFFLFLLRDSYYLHKNRKEDDGILYSLLFSCFLGFGFISLFDFPLERFSHGIIFFTLASIVISKKIKIVNIKIPLFYTFLLFAITCFCIYVASIRYQGEIHVNNALGYKSKGNWEYVIKAIEEAYNSDFYQMENTSTPLFWYRGVAYFSQKKYDLALKDFQSAHKLNPYHIHVLNNLATSYEINGNSKKAKNIYYSIFKVNPTFKEARVNLAAILYNERKYVDALDMILQSKVDPSLERKQNNDNYDLYLKTIISAWIKSVYDKSSANDKQLLNDWQSRLNSPASYDAIRAEAVSVFNIRKNKKIDYLTALKEMGRPQYYMMMKKKK